MTVILFRLALRNISRQIVRTVMTLAAIVLGVAGLILSGGFVQDIFKQLGEAVIHSQTGHLQVVKLDYFERGTRNPNSYLIEEPDSLSNRISALDEVDYVAARLGFSGLLNNGKRDLAIIGEGIEPSKESRLGTYLQITEGRQLTDEDPFGILLGQGVAHSMGMKPGDSAVIITSSPDGAMNTMDFEVVGIFQSFSKDFDARAVRIPLHAAQELMFSSGANVLVVTLHRTENTDTALERIQSQLSEDGLEVRNWRQISDFYDKTVQLYDRQFGVLQLIILFMVLLSVTNSVNMSTFERMSEFGTLGALGNRRHSIFWQIMVENAILGLIGASIGVVAGVLIALLVSIIGIPMPPPPNANVGYTAYIMIIPQTVASAFLIGLLATVLAAIVPARRVSNTRIVTALRQGS